MISPKEQAKRMVDEEYQKITRVGNFSENWREAKLNASWRVFWALTDEETPTLMLKFWQDVDKEIHKL